MVEFWNAIVSSLNIIWKIEIRLSFNLGIKESY